MSQIKALKARPIIDSRGQWTLEVSLKTEAGEVVTGVPAGASCGKNEAVVIETFRAIDSINQKIAPALLGQSVLEQNKLDQLLLSLDGTEDKSNLGGNALLGVSQAILKAGALSQGKFLWQYIQTLANAKINPTGPQLLVNLINGGTHAGGTLAFQEYLYIPQTDTLSQTITEAVSVYGALKKVLLKELGPSAINLGDEGGFTPALTKAEEPFALISQVASDFNFKLGLDAAGNELAEAVAVDWYEKLIADFPIAMIEDPFAETEMESFSQLKARVSGQAKVIGDDLTVSQANLINQANQAEAIDGVIIKPNQVGTITETLEAVKTATENDLAIIVSHRSGETTDDLIADLAFGLGAWGFKLGAPARGERVAKYNRLLEIEQEYII